MATSSTTLQQRYHQSVWGTWDRTLRNCFVGSGILGLLVLIAVFIAPAPSPVPMEIEQVPERFARLILKKPAPPAAPPATTQEQVATVVTPPPAPVPEPAKRPQAVTDPVKPKPNRRQQTPQVAPDKGVQGRKKAEQEVKANLVQVTSSLDQALENLSSVLPAKETSTGGAKDGTVKKRRRPSVRSGRGSKQVSTVSGNATLAAADVTGSALKSSSISIPDITDLNVDGVEGGTGMGGGGASGGSADGTAGSSTGAGSAGDYRSNESLLSVVRRYAPGIQFCYDNELKRNPGLRGKIVVSLTVLASGEVSEVVVVQNSMGSTAVTECMLAQIKSWQFPSIPHGVTRFKTPFVFTPPDS